MNDSPEPRRMTSLDRKIEAAGRRAREEAAQHARGEPVLGDITGIGQGDAPMIQRDMPPRTARMIDRDEPKRTVEAIVAECDAQLGTTQAEASARAGISYKWAVFKDGVATDAHKVFPAGTVITEALVKQATAELLSDRERMRAARLGRERDEAQLRATWEASPEKRITEAVKPEFAAMPGDAIAKIQFGRNIMRAMHPHKQEAADIQSSQARARNASMLGDSDMAKRFAEHNLGRGFRLEDRAAGNPCKAGDIISVPPGAFVTGRRVERFTVPMSSAKMGEPMVYRGGCTVRLAVLEGGEVEVMVEYPATE